jgi:ABC-type hemin transport system ATPase subunit
LAKHTCECISQLAALTAACTSGLSVIVILHDINSKFTQQVPVSRPPGTIICETAATYFGEVNILHISLGQPRASHVSGRL